MCQILSPCRPECVIETIESETGAIGIAKKPLGLQTPQANDEPFSMDGVIGDKIYSKYRQSTFAAQSLFRADLRWITWGATLRILNALQGYKQRTGKDVDSIEQLGLPKDATIDPWSGRPLIMKKTDQGWLVYSVGLCGVDNGGKLEINWSEGVEPPGYSVEK